MFNAELGCYEIVIPDGAKILFDPSDLDLVNPHAWNATKAYPGAPTRYATTEVDGKAVRMHHLLMGKRRGYDVDHKNRNSLDNRRENLRWATRGQNCANRQARGGKYPYRGILQECGKWYAKASKRENGGRKFIRTGPFASAEEAARDYDRLARELWGEFALLNFPEDSQVA